MLLGWGRLESRVFQVLRVLGPGCPGPRRTGSGVRAPRRARGTGSVAGRPALRFPGSGSLEPGAEGAEEAAARGGAPRSPKLASSPRGQEGRAETLLRTLGAAGSWHQSPGVCLWTESICALGGRELGRQATP